MKRGRFSEEQIIAMLREHEAGAKASEQARDLGSNAVQLEGQVRRSGCFGGEAAEDARGEEPQAQEAAGRIDARQRSLEGASVKKRVGPAAKREAVAHLRGALELKRVEFDPLLDNEKSRYSLDTDPSKCTTLYITASKPLRRVI
jgi:putative transposase